VRWGICLVLAVRIAAADSTVRDDDKLKADRLFAEGRALLDQGKRQQACEKFDLSIRKDPRAVGTILNLGLCAEEAGQIATAVRYYTEARARAKNQDLHEHQQAAEAKLALLAPRVPHLAIALPPGAPADTRVIVDQLVLAPDQLTDVAPDPGERSIVVTARDKLPFETRITIKEGDHQTLAIPALRGARTVVVQPSSKRLWGKILVGSGVALAAAGTRPRLLRSLAIRQAIPHRRGRADAGRPRGRGRRNIEADRRARVGTALEHRHALRGVVRALEADRFGAAAGIGRLRHSAADMVVVHQVQHGRAGREDRARHTVITVSGGPPSRAWMPTLPDIGSVACAASENVPRAVPA
jgi:tetratricopeptide (TPR) repeat protein